MLDRSLFAAFDSATPLAHGLPREAYLSDAFFAVESERLFGRHWVFAGFAHRLARSGDALPVVVGNVPLFLLRDDAGNITGFHNVCRHRNLQLIDAAGNCGKLIRCPYHAWSYALDGRLKRAPCFGGGVDELPADFDLSAHGLLPVACEVWHDWVFVNLAAEPAPFDEFVAPLQRQLGDVDPGDYRPVATLDFGEVACNWKLLMENFIEPYHVQFVHRSTTRQPLDAHRTVVDAHCCGSEVEIDPADTIADASTLGVTSHYLTLFPNFVLGTYQPDQLGVYLHESLAVDRTRQTRVIYTHRDADYSDAQIGALEDLWRRVHAEDHAMCVRLQRGRASPAAADGGLLSPCWENSVRHFQELVADAIRPALTD